MTMTPWLRKFALTTHVISSVGWLGAVAGFLALAIAGLKSQDSQMVRAAYLAMKLTGWLVIVPLSLATLLTGLVQSLGTSWGLFRHWWILAKFLLTIVALVVLLRHMQDVSRVAQLAKETSLSTADFRPELIHAAGGLLIVLAATMLSVFKPWGMTPYGLSKAKQTESPSRSSDALVEVREPVFAASRPRWGRIIGLHAIGLVLLAVIILHRTGGGFRHH